MSKSDSKKTDILVALEQQTKAISLKELLDVLGKNFAERSVRRWLSQLAGEGLVRKIGQKSSTRYEAVFALSPNAKEAIEYVQQPIFKRMPIEYNEHWLNEYLVNETRYLSEKTVAQLMEVGQRDHQDDPAGTYAKRIVNRLLIDLSYNSSRLEGNTYSLLDTEKLILEGDEAPGKLDEEKIMILNHKEAIRHLVDFSSRIEINYNEICTLHYLLSDGLVQPQYSGKVRDHGVAISASTYSPIENKTELERLLNVICQKARLINNPFEQSFFLLVHISYLQAFIDVNKRTSRLSTNIPLIKGNYVPLSFNDVDKDEYTSAMLAIYELNDVRPLAELYTYSYLRSCRLYDINVEQVAFDVVRVTYRNERREMIRQIISEELIGNELDNFIAAQTAAKISTKDQEKFKNTVLEDLTLLSPQRIAGLGITLIQLQRYLQKRSHPPSAASS